MLPNSHLQKPNPRQAQTRTVIIQHLNDAVTQSGKFKLKKGVAVIRWKKTSFKERLSRFKFPRNRFTSLQTTYQNLQKELQQYCYVQYYNHLQKNTLAHPLPFVQRVAKRLPKVEQERLLKHILRSNDSPSIISKEEFFKTDPLFKGPKDMDPEFITNFSVHWDILNIAHTYTDYTSIPFNTLKYLADVCLMSEKQEELKDFNQGLGAKIGEFLFFRNPPEILSSWSILYSNGPELITKEEDFIISILKLYLHGSPDGSITADMYTTYKKILNVLTYRVHLGSPRYNCNIYHSTWRSLFYMLPYKEPFLELLDIYYAKDTTPTSVAIAAQGLKSQLEAEEKTLQVTPHSFPHHYPQMNACMHALLNQISIKQKIALLNEFQATPEGGEFLSSPIKLSPLGILEHIASNGNIPWQRTSDRNAFQSAFNQFLQTKTVQ